MSGALRWFLVVIVALSWASESNAGTRKLCFSLAEDFIDPSPRTDFFPNNVNRRLRGIRVKVQRGATTVFEGFAEDTGANRGCVTVTMLPQAHTVSLLSKIRVNDREAWAVNSSGVETVVVATGVYPAKAPLEILVDWEKRWPELDVAGWMLHRHQLGLGPGLNDTIKFQIGLCCIMIYADVHADGFAAGWSGPQKFTIAHEVGHFIGAYADEETSPLFDYNAPLDGCDGAVHAPQATHHFFQKEFQSAASNEGWANFVAAWTFNSQNQSDCILARQNFETIDFDLTAPNTDLPSSGEFSCEGMPWDLNGNQIVDSFETDQIQTWVTSRDWLSDAVAGHPSCTGPTTNRGSEYDWTRYWWDMYTDENLSFSKLLQVYDLMGPRAWDPNGGTSAVGDDPVFRLSLAATLAGVATEHNNQSDNGVDH